MQKFIALGMILLTFIGCGQTGSPKPTHGIETIEARIQDSIVGWGGVPTPVLGPDYFQSTDSVTIMVDNYWRRSKGDVVPVTLEQQIVTQQTAHPETYEIQPVYNDAELELLSADPQTATWIFKPKKTGVIVLRLRKTFICNACQDMPITTIPIELNVTP